MIFNSVNVNLDGIINFEKKTYGWIAFKSLKYRQKWLPFWDDKSIDAQTNNK